MTFGIGRKIEFSNWNFKLRVNYSFALTFIFYSAHAVHRRLAAGAATGHPTRRAPAKPVLRAPGFDETSLPGTSHARHAVERRRLADTTLDIRATRRRATALAAALAVLLGS